MEKLSSYSAIKSKVEGEETGGFSQAHCVSPDNFLRNQSLGFMVKTGTILHGNKLTLFIQYHELHWFQLRPCDNYLYNCC